MVDVTVVKLLRLFPELIRNDAKERHIYNKTINSYIRYVWVNGAINLSTFWRKSEWFWYIVFDNDVYGFKFWVIRKHDIAAVTGFPYCMRMRDHMLQNKYRWTVIISNLYSINFSLFCSLNSFPHENKYDELEHLKRELSELFNSKTNDFTKNALFIYYTDSEVYLNYRWNKNKCLVHEIWIVSLPQWKCHPV